MVRHASLFSQLVALFPKSAIDFVQTGSWAHVGPKKQSESL